MAQTGARPHEESASAALAAAGQLSAADGDPFATLVRLLAEVVGVRYAFVAECVDEPATRVRMLAFWVGDHLGENVEYDLAGTPCERVIGGEVCVHPRGVQGLFPDAADLVTLSAESYLGLPLRDEKGRAVGHLAILDEQIMARERASEPVLRVFAALAGAELGRLRANRAAASAEERFRVLAENAYEAIAETDEEGIFRYVSPNHEQILGYKPDELLGTPFAVHVHPEDLPRASDLLQGVIKNGGQMRNRSRARHKSGEWLWLEATARAYVTEGGEHRILHVTRDITEAKQAEEALRASEERLRLILSSLSSTFVSVYDRDCVLTAVYGNTGVAYGLSRSDAIDSTADAYLPKGEPDEAHALIRRVFDTGVPTTATQTVHLPGGKFVFDLALSPIRGSADEVENVLVVCHDVTEREAAARERGEFETRMQQAQKLESLGVLAGGIAHDFNNLLVGICGNTELAISQLGPDSPTRELLKDVEQAGHLAADLTDQLLAYAGRTRPQRAPVELSGLVRDMEHLLRASVPKSIVFRIVGKEPAWLEADPTQIRQVVMNLVTNAAEAVPDGRGAVVLETGIIEADADDLRHCLLVDGLEPGEFAYVEVHDNGTGISEGEISRIFDPFFSTKFQGRGLGLSAVMGIVRGHRGTMRVDSRPLGGTTFRALFPRVLAPELAHEDERARSAGWRGEGRVLVVDDVPAVRNVATRILEGVGFDLCTAGDGSEAIEVFAGFESEIVAVLLDLAMPGMDGEETLRRLREIRPELPVLVMSGFSDEQMAARLLDEPGIATLRKPFTMRALTDAMRGLLESGGAAATP